MPCASILTPRMGGAIKSVCHCLEFAQKVNSRVMTSSARSGSFIVQSPDRGQGHWLFYFFTHRGVWIASFWHIKWFSCMLTKVLKLKSKNMWSLLCMFASMLDNVCKWVSPALCTNSWNVHPVRFLMMIWMKVVDYFTQIAMHSL